MIHVSWKSNRFLFRYFDNWSIFILNHVFPQRKEELIPDLFVDDGARLGSVQGGLDPDGLAVELSGTDFRNVSATVDLLVILRMLQSRGVGLLLKPSCYTSRLGQML